MTGHRTPDSTDGVKIVILSSGTRVHLDDIETAALGQSHLDDLDASIDRIEAQLTAAANGTWAAADLSWRVRAEMALKRKRRMRPRLQQRIGELRRAEKAEAIGDTRAVAAAKVDAKRRAFVLAAYEVLGHEACTEVWARAQERQPNLFADQTGTP